MTKKSGQGDDCCRRIQLSALRSSGREYRLFPVAVEVVVRVAAIRAVVFRVRRKLAANQAFHGTFSPSEHSRSHGHLRLVGAARYVAHVVVLTRACLLLCRKMRQLLVVGCLAPHRHIQQYEVFVAQRRRFFLYELTSSQSSDFVKETGRFLSSTFAPPTSQPSPPPTSEMGRRNTLRVPSSMWRGPSLLVEQITEPPSHARCVCSPPPSPHSNIDFTGPYHPPTGISPKRDEAGGVTRRGKSTHGGSSGSRYSGGRGWR